MDGIIRDPQAFPRYVMTGNGSTMMSNRISHFFDLRGASVTVDTGCSTGLTALHQACQSLRTGESDISIIGGANIMLNPDVFVLISSLGYDITSFILLAVMTFFKGFLVQMVDLMPSTAEQLVMVAVRVFQLSSSSLCSRPSRMATLYEL